LKSAGKILKLSLALLLGLLIIWLSLKGLSPEEKKDIITSFKIANYWWVLLSVFIGVVSHFTRALRWKLLLKPIGYDISLKNSFLAVMIGYFANMGIPRSGELIRCSILYKEEKVPVDKGFGTVVIERGIDFLIFLSVFVVVFFAEYKRVSAFVQANVFDRIDSKLSLIYSEYGLIYLILGIALLFFLVFLIFRKKISNSKIWKSIISFISISKIQKPFLFIIYTIVIWFFYYLMVYICFFSLEQTSSLGPLSGMTVLALGTIAIMVTPGGIGLYPLIVMQTLALYHVESSIGWAMGWITWSAQSLMIIIFGSISLLIVSLKKGKNGIFSAKFAK
jgi:uncharacterized protein (TIRG00374 family)